VKAEYRRPIEGGRISQSGVSLPSPSHADVVAHSPTPSMHSTAAVVNGDG
jgi:hypothetical protein